jgi:predicted metal-dependent HD superfamily phosphohydrolase
VNTPTLERWARVWRRVAPTANAGPVYRALVLRYSEPHRHYHNLQHLAECLIEFDSASHLASDPVAVELAIWFHDANYDTHAPDNEERSADFTRQCIKQAKGSAVLCEAVAALVMSTKTHEPSAHPDAALLIDVDLSILGQPQDRFQEYETQIRREYDWVPESTFASKRAEILEQFLGRGSIYATEQFFMKYEQQALSNLRDSIRALKLK